MPALCGILLAAALTGTASAQEADFDPNSVDVVDAIECRLVAPDYNGFAAAISGEEAIADHRHWVRVKTSNPFMNEYDLPEPITVAGHYVTRRIAFTSNGVFAMLDLADPAVLGRELGMTNSMDPEPFINAMAAKSKVRRAELEAQIAFRKFLGEKVVSDTTELPGKDETFGFHTVITRSVSNDSTHPGKTFYGCAYRVDLVDAAGKPL